MAAQLPRVCALTDLALSRLNTHREVVLALLQGGARWIQIREKRVPARLFALDAVAAVAAARRAGALALINDRIDIALVAGADGVHVGRDDLPPEEARRLLGSARLIGASTHSVEEGIAASLRPVDYVAIGPVFPTRSKRDAEPAVGIDAVSRLACAIRLPVVAIGGIDPSNARAVLDAGAEAVAVLGCLYSAGSIEEGVTALLERI